ncbi:hypothetical protein THAOC_04465 [Thalassiosira oceanica]|uniref:Uncharacterized protein n=1 Tax=Thalassiosira oceanica TaxID=159749 RepID=K0T9W3_THAOC|nr:hypothetical protein THAOC_04465 [Thalassiosira oceanica]|eukprot:EJK73889.1 hypothetical protein THAOC_04465 [Thalassiosira oceanica]
MFPPRGLFHEARLRCHDRTLPGLRRRDVEFVASFASRNGGFHPRYQTPCRTQHDERNRSHGQRLVPHDTISRRLILDDQVRLRLIIFQYGHFVAVFLCVRHAPADLIAFRLEVWVIDRSTYHIVKFEQELPTGCPGRVATIIVFRHFRLPPAAIAAVI